MTMMHIAVLLPLFCLLGQSAAQYVCYRDSLCAVNETRPIFTLGDSLDECCGMPNILAAMEHSSINDCSLCPPLTVNRVTSATIVLMPPETLVIEISASGYSAVTWIHDGNTMHDFPQLDLEDFSKRLLIYNTTSADYGVYEADVHAIDPEDLVETLTFLVIPAFMPSPTIPTSTATAEGSGEETKTIVFTSSSAIPVSTPTPTALPLLNVTAWPESIEVNLFQTDKTVVFICEGQSTPTLLWTSNIDSTLLNPYCGSSLSELGEAPLDYEFTIEPTTTSGGDTDETLAPSEAFGEAPITSLPTPAVTVGPPPTEGGLIPGLPPQFCSVQAVITGDRVHSVLTVNTQLLQRSVNFTCAAIASGTGDPVNQTASVGLRVVDTPFFDTRPNPTINTIISLYVELECVATGFIEPTITWYRRNLEDMSLIVISGSEGRVSITNDTFPSFQGPSSRSVVGITNVQLLDSAEYICQASNIEGTSEAVSNVYVRAPANITRPPEDFSASVSGTAAFVCRSIGVPIPNIMWAYVESDGSLRFLDETSSTPSPNSSSIIMASAFNHDLNWITKTLVIRNVRLTDEGEYACITENGVTLQNLTNIILRASAHLDVTLECSPEEFLCGSDEQCVPAYSVCDREVDCEDGSDESGCNELAATITKGPTNDLTSVFDTVLFLCESTGIPIPDISWSQREEGGSLVTLDNKTQLQTGTPIRFQTNFNYVTNVTVKRLYLMSVDVSDAGEYVCLTSNGVESQSPRIMQTASAFLNVSTIPHVVMITVIGESTTFQEGTTIILLCDAQGNPTPQITWLRNGKPISLNDSRLIGAREDPSSKYTITQESLEEGRTVSELYVRDALPGLDRDEGEYTCRLDNIVDEDTAAPAVDTVELIIQARNDCLVDVRLTGVTPCQNNATCEDTVGGYMCICTGQFGGANCAVPVPPVVDVPEIVEGPEDQNEVEIFQQVTFTCSATGEPQPVYSWQQDGEFVTNTSEGQLELLEVRPEHRGFYTCVAHNIFGSSLVSTAGLLSLRGIYQYLVTFSDCSIDGFDELLELMSTSLAGRQLNGIDSTIYSITPRPVADQPSPTDQVIITVHVGGGYELLEGSTRDIKEAIFIELNIFSGTHGCNFIDITRFDGCPQTSYTFNEEFSDIISWSETDLNRNDTILCPCGNLEPKVHGSRTLARSCGGTYSYGAEWENVVDGCGFSSVAFELCDITTLDISDQFEELVEVTEEADSFNSLDISIASAVIKNIVLSDEIITNVDHQEGFSQAWSNLLETSKDIVAESQLKFGSSSSLLDSLELFARRIQLNSTNNSSRTKFDQDLLKIQVEDMPLSEFSGSTFTPDLEDMAKVFQNNTIENPLMGVTISLPEALASYIQQFRNSSAGSPPPDEALRVINFVLLRDTFFVSNEVEEDFGEQQLGNVFIAASLSFPEQIRDLMDPVVIDFIQTEGLNSTNITSNATCVFWELPTTSSYGKWSSEGCKLVSAVGDDVVKCECNHLTHFGVLLAIDPLPSNIGVEFSLEIISYVGIGLSLICILVILLTFVCSRKLRKREMSRMIINMCIPLGLFYIWFLLAIHGKHYSTVLWFCYICSACVQYFLLVYLFWTAIQAFHIYLKLVKVFGSKIHYFALKSAVFAWGIPFIITAISAGFGIAYNLWAVYDLNDNTLYICYPSKWPLYFGVIAPFILIFLFNLILFVIIMVSLALRFHQSSKMRGDIDINRNKKLKELKELRKLIVIGTSLSVMFGLGWAFGLLAQIPEQVISTAAQYIFSVFIGFQGVLIFILHGLRSTDVRKQWKRWMYKVLCCVKTPPELLTSTAQSQSPSTSKTVAIKKHPTSPVALPSEDRHSKNPIYQSQDDLDAPDGKPTDTTYTPARNVTEATELVSAFDFDRNSEDVESQTVEVPFHALEESSDEDEKFDLSDIRKIPFSKGALGTALGPNMVEDVDEGDTSHATEL